MGANLAAMDPCWIDTHCHLDAAEFDPDRDEVVARARAAGVGMMVLPAVERANWERVADLAHRYQFAYALGIHPLYVPWARAEDLEALREELSRRRGDPRLVAVGEIGLDFFVRDVDPALQEQFYLAQLKIARDAGLPVLLHVRRSADALLKGLRRIEVSGGIAHAFNGSLQQAMAFIDRGFVLGFGGAVTFDRALQLRRLLTSIPEHGFVLETDAPDIPPQWLYKTAAQRRAGERGRNEPAELPRVGHVIAELRRTPMTDLAHLTCRNAISALAGTTTLTP